MPSAQRKSHSACPRHAPSPSPHRTHPGIPGLPHKASSQTAGPHPQQGGREGAAGAGQSGKGKTLEKPVTRESPHVSQRSFTEIIHSALRIAGPGCAGGPTRTRDPATTTQPQGRRAPVLSTHLRAAYQAHASPRAQSSSHPSSSVSRTPSQALLLFSEVTEPILKYFPHPHRPAYLPGDT